MFLKNNPEIQDDNIAVITEELQTFTYANLKDKVRNFGQRLQLDEQNLVFNVCENNLGSLVSYLAFLENEHCKQLLLSSQISEVVFYNLVSKYNPNLICLPKSTDLTPKDYEVFIQNDDTTVLKSIKNFKHKINPDLGLLLSTSGSTGSPKLVMLSYKNLISNAQSIAEYLNITSSDRALTTLPMSYAYGLSIIHSHLIKGATIVLSELSVMDKNFWSLIAEANVTSFGGVPYTYEMLKRLKFDKQDFKSLRYITQAGGKLKPELVKFFGDICESKDIEFIIMYGQTEATARMSYFSYSKHKDKYGSIGKAIPGGEFFLENENTQRIKESNTIGELVYKGDNVSLGYAKNPSELQIPDQREGVLKTGDLARMDEDGFYYIVGRKNRFLKICGNRYSLGELENILDQNKIEALCSGNDDLLVIFTTSENSNAKKIISSTVKINPRYIKTMLLEEFPRNSYGKVDHKALKELVNKEFNK